MAASVFFAVTASNHCLGLKDIAIDVGQSAIKVLQLKVALTYQTFSDVLYENSIIVSFWEDVI